MFTYLVQSMQKNWGKTIAGVVIGFFFLCATVGYVGRKHEEAAAPLAQRVAEATKPLPDLRDKMKVIRGALRRAQLQKRPANADSSVADARQIVGEVDKTIPESAKTFADVEGKLSSLSQWYHDDLQKLITEAREALVECRRDSTRIRLMLLGIDLKASIEGLDDARDQLRKLARGAPIPPKLVAEIKAATSKADTLAKDNTAFKDNLKKNQEDYEEEELESLEKMIGDGEATLAEHMRMLKLWVKAREGNLADPEAGLPPPKDKALPVPLPQGTTMTA